MAPKPNWQIRALLEGCRGSVPVRQLNGVPAMGSIGKTQITRQGFIPSRPVYKPHTLPRRTTTSLLKLSLMKRSLSGASLVKPVLRSDGRMPSFHAHEAMKSGYRRIFFSKLLGCAARGVKLWGPDIVLGIDHTHFSQMDQLDKSEQNGRYKSLPPIPERFMLDAMGQLVPWVAGPLSDNRSNGEWVLQYSSFFVNDQMEDDDVQIPDHIAILRVGRFRFI